jgi:hypothetical protein
MRKVCRSDTYSTAKCLVNEVGVLERRVRGMADEGVAVAGVVPGHHLYGVFIAAPWTLEPIPFWRAVYGYVHSRVVSSLTPRTMSEWGEVFAEELKAMWWAPTSILPESTRKRILELIFSEPTFGISSGRSRTKPEDHYYDRNIDDDDNAGAVSGADPRAQEDEAREEVVDEVVQSIDAHRIFLQQTLRWLYLTAAPTWLAVEFDKHGVKYEVTQDDLTRVFARTKEDIASIQFALGFGPDSELKSLRMAEVALRTDNVVMLELMGRLPPVELLSHALEVEARKVTRRVLTAQKGRTRHVNSSTVYLAVEMRAYDMVELFMDHVTTEQKLEILQDLSHSTIIYGRACEIILDSIPDAPAIDEATPRERFATSWVHEFYLHVIETKEFNKGFAPEDWMEIVRATLRVCLAKYNMVDTVVASWFEEMVQLGLGTEARANRERFAETFKQRLLKTKKDKLRLKAKTAQSKARRGGRR